MSLIIAAHIFSGIGYNTPLSTVRARPTVGGAHLSSTLLVSGVQQGDYLIDEPAYHIHGSLAPGVNDSFYNRVLVEPSLLDMGNLLSNQTRVVKVWNGFLANSTLQDVQRINDAGMTLDQPVTAPYTMRPLEELTYVLSITTDGPATIDARYVWVVDGAGYSAQVVGKRVVVFPYGPNWSSPVTETLEWMTDIMRSFDGKEQRRSLRTKARRRLGYQMSVTREDSARLDNLLWGWQNRTFAVPVWTDKPRLHYTHAPGDIALSVDTETYSFTDNGLAVVFADATHYEVVEIDTVEPGVVNLKRPLEQTWPSGTIAYPCLLGHLPTSVATTRLTSNTAIASIEFAFSPADTDPNTPEAAPEVVYDGLEVLLRQPNWISPLDNTFDYRFATRDFQVGSIEWDTMDEFPRIARKYTWLLRDRNQIAGFREMLGRLHGQFNTLRIPSWHDDFICNRVIGAADVSISVNDNSFRNLVGVDPARDRLMVRLKNGDIYYRKLVGISQDIGGVLLTMDESLGVQVEADQVQMIHLLMTSRLATDQVKLTWRSNEVATVDTTFTSVLE